MVEVLGGLDQSVLVKDTVLAQRTVNDTTQTSPSRRNVNGAVLMALIEQGSHFVALLELLDLGADLGHLTSAVGGGDHRELEGEGVHSLLQNNTGQFILEPNQPGDN